MDIKWQIRIFSRTPRIEVKIHACKSFFFTARRFITVQVNCTYCVADCNNNCILYSECTCSGGWIFRNYCTKAATSSTVSHICDVTPYRTVFFIRTSNFASSLTQQQCLLSECYCFWWNWQNTEQNVQCSSLSLYLQTVYSGKYSGHCVVLFNVFYLSMLHYLCNATCYNYLHFTSYTLCTYVFLFVC